jgi:hypothetical protein
MLENAFRSSKNSLAARRPHAAPGVGGEADAWKNPLEDQAIPGSRSLSQ